MPRIKVAAVILITNDFVCVAGGIDEASLDVGVTQKLV
jgi:hypothetical protein